MKVGKTNSTYLYVLIRLFFQKLHVQAIDYIRRMAFLFMVQRSKLLRGFGNLLVRTEARRMKIFMAFSKDGWVTKIPPHSYGGMMR